jgi:hypothetical protein
MATAAPAVESGGGATESDRLGLDAGVLCQPAPTRQTRQLSRSADGNVTRP